MTKFRVGVVTIMEVEVDTDSFRDASRVAEGAINYLIGLGNTSEGRERPVVKWRHRNGADYEVALVRAPIELGAAARNDCFTVAVPQPLLPGATDGEAS